MPHKRCEEHAKKRNNEEFASIHQKNALQINVPFETKATANCLLNPSFLNIAGRGQMLA